MIPTITEEQRLALLLPYDRNKYRIYMSALSAMTGNAGCDCDKIGVYKTAKKQMIKRGLDK